MTLLRAALPHLFQDPLPPQLVREALKLVGTRELSGSADNPTIVRWAEEVAGSGRPYDRWAADFYNHDSIPWCGLFCAVVASRVARGRPDWAPPRNYLAALAWSAWGNPAPRTEILVGDVVVLIRKGGGHVFFAVGVSGDGGRVIGVGGNQDNAVTVASFDASRIYAIRRPSYRSIPAGARRVIVAGPSSPDPREA